MAFRVSRLATSNSHRMTQLVAFILKPMLSFLPLPVRKPPNQMSSYADWFAELGIDLGTVTFQAFFMDTLVGRESFKLCLSLPYQRTLSSSCRKRLIPRRKRPNKDSSCWPHPAPERNRSCQPWHPFLQVLGWRESNTHN
jgi:hypothetical protein